MREIDEEKRLRSNWRGRRLLACRAVDQLTGVIAHLGEDDGTTLPPEGGLPTPPTDSLRAEIENAATNLLRLVLIHNDGHVSPHSLRAF